MTGKAAPVMKKSESSFSSSNDPFNDDPSQNPSNNDCSWTLENNHQAQGKQLIKVSEQSLYRS